MKLRLKEMSMMTNLEILSEDKILTLKNNKKQVLDCMLSSSNNSWLKDFFREENPFSKSKLMVKDFDLKLADEDNLQYFDLDNAIILHENLRLTDSQACDERLWISLCFGKFYDYMQSRWNVKTRTNLNEHWLFPHGQKRSLYFNGISRLYWFAHITYDASLKDPYEITKFCFTNIQILAQMIYRGYSNSKSVRLALLKAIKSYTEDGGSLNQKILYGILKYVSFLGGAYILDSFTEKELFDKCYLKLIDLYIEEYPDQKIFKL